MFEKEAEEYREKGKNEGYYLVAQEMEQEELDYIIDESFKDGAEFGYNKANEWHNLNENSKDLPGEDEWVAGLYIWYYKDKPQWDIFKVRWFYEIGELDDKLVCWYSSDDCWHKVDEPDYWRKINLPTRNEHDRKY